MKIGVALFGVAALCLSTVTLAQTDSFAAEMDAAMVQMHRAMMTGYSGNPDRDFARMMIPHHQGAIDMAQIELRYGKDERLRRLAQGIIVEQRQEIAVMQDILSETSTAPTTSVPPHHPMTHGDHQ